MLNYNNKPTGVGNMFDIPVVLTINNYKLSSFDSRSS